jgi:hypothetical protein
MNGSACECGWQRPTVGVFDGLSGEIVDLDASDYVVAVLCPRCARPAFQGHPRSAEAKVKISAEVKDSRTPAVAAVDARTAASSVSGTSARRPRDGTARPASSTSPAGTPESGN